MYILRVPISGSILVRAFPLVVLNFITPSGISALFVPVLNLYWKDPPITPCEPAYPVVPCEPA